MRRARAPELDRPGAAAGLRLGAAGADLPAQPGSTSRRCGSRRSPRADSLPAAGLPWFMTLFGRDSIFTSLQALPFAPELAADDAARAGPAGRGTRVDDFRDEEPGRILHEMRYGETAAFQEQPHSPYYGTADATPLFVVLLDEYERWTGDAELVRELERRPAPRCAGSTTTATCSATATSPTSAATRRPAWRTSAGRTPGTRSPTATAGCPASRGPPASCRATPTTPRSAAPGWPGRLGRPGVRRRAGAAGRRPQAPVQPRLLGRRRRVLRARAGRRRRAGRRPVLQHRPPAVERHRRRRAGRRRSPSTCSGRGCSPAGGCARSPRARRATTRSATTSARSGRSTTRSSPGVCAATASRTRRRDRGRHPGRGRVLPRPAAGGVRRLRPRAHASTRCEYPTACSPQAWSTGRAAAAAAHDAGAGAAWASTWSSTRRCRWASAASSCSTSRPVGPGRRVRPQPWTGGPAGRRLTRAAARFSPAADGGGHRVASGLISASTVTTPLRYAYTGGWSSSGPLPASGASAAVEAAWPGPFVDHAVRASPPPGQGAVTSSEAASPGRSRAGVRRSARRSPGRRRWPGPACSRCRPAGNRCRRPVAPGRRRSAGPRRPRILRRRRAARGRPRRPDPGAPARRQPLGDAGQHGPLVTGGREHPYLAPQPRPVGERGDPAAGRDPRGAQFQQTGRTCRAGQLADRPVDHRAGLIEDAVRARSAGRSAPISR